MGPLGAMPQDESRYLEAAAECIALAHATQDQGTRAGLLVLAQKWIDLARHKSDSTSLATLELLNDPRIKKQ
jgi:hypothetical protein